MVHQSATPPLGRAPWRRRNAASSARFQGADAPHGARSPKRKIETVRVISSENTHCVERARLGIGREVVIYACGPERITSSGRGSARILDDRVTPIGCGVRHGWPSPRPCRHTDAPNCWRPKSASSGRCSTPLPHVVLHVGAALAGIAIGQTFEREEPKGRPSNVVAMIMSRRAACGDHSLRSTWRSAERQAVLENDHWGLPFSQHCGLA